MKIGSIVTAIPSRIVTNQEIVDMIYQESKEKFSGDLDSTLSRIKTTLEYSGLNTRVWS